jgi:hypothetical protein
MTTRFQTENGEVILEVRTTTVERIFDNRDPAPFRERALDPDFVEYLVEGGRDRAAAGRIRIIVWLAQPCAPGEIEQAVEADFEQALERTQRRRREQLRTGWIALAVAVIAVLVLMGLGELVAKNVAGTLGDGLRPWASRCPDLAEPESPCRPAEPRLQDRTWSECPLS